MIKRLASTIAIILALLAPSVVKAGYMNRGVGMATCGKFIQNAATRRDAMNWVLGFTTAVSATFSAERVDSEPVDVLNGADYDAIELWLINYCTANPLKQVADATYALLYASKDGK